MRKIIIEVEVSSRQRLEVLADDLKAEIACCWNCFDVDTMKVSEIKEKTELISKKHLLSEIKELKASPWFNSGKDIEKQITGIEHALYIARKEAVEILEDYIKQEPGALL